MSTDAFTHHYAVELRADADNHRNQNYTFPGFEDGVRLAAGIYLTRSTPVLFDLFVDATAIQVANVANPPVAQTEQTEFGEVKRFARERYFFARNPGLAAAMKQRDNYICRICRFNFEEVYGSLGRGYAECHHLDPLSERPEAQWTDELKTRLDRAITLCANCHRVIHRTRPARLVNVIDEAINVRNGIRGEPFALRV